MNRVLGISCAIALTLLLVQIGHAGEPVWCYQVRRGDTPAAIARRFGASMRGAPVDEAAHDEYARALRSPILAGGC